MSCNPNPLDPCTRSLMQCDNPCKTNEPCPELLPTQMDTFITQFFGAVGKSNQGGSVGWTLPCGLDAGIAANPRLPGESLGCYFLRLFEAGVSGTRGEQGPCGATGLAGPDAYSMTEQNFAQPSLASPYVSLKITLSAIMITGLYVAVAGSGIYQIQNVAADGTSLLQLFVSLAPEGSTIPAGALVVQSGYPGIATVGPRGEKGDTGQQGLQGGIGAQGLPGSQGAQGANVALLGGNVLPQGQHAIGLSSVYQGGVAAQGFPIFTAPNTQGATYFVLAALNMFFSETRNPPSGAGKLYAKIVAFDGLFEVGDVVGTERSTGNDTALALPGGAIGIGRLLVIPYFAVNPAGHQYAWIPYFKSTITGDYQSFFSTSYSMQAWFKL